MNKLADITEHTREPAPPDPRIKPDGIRDRAMRAVEARGPQREDREKTRARPGWAFWGNQAE